MKDRSSKLAEFGDLVGRVHACRKCARMSDSARVLGLGCGPIDSQLMFVGEAPGRLGADESLMPFHGDTAGRNFESLIEQVGLSRYDVFVTNAVLCNPKDENGNNSVPTAVEISNCAPFLREQVELLNPKVVVTLGSTALKASSLVEPHSLSLAKSVRTLHQWHGRKLIPIYHPGQRAMVHRSYANQLADYQFVAETLRRGDKHKRIASRAIRKDGEKIAHVARRILEQQPEGISYFALHKLYFLTEVAYLEEIGERLSNAYVVRQKDGPYCVDLHLSKLAAMMPDVVLQRVRGGVRVAFEPQRTFDDRDFDSDLTERERMIIDATVRRFRGATNAKLKRMAYLSAPMRDVLRKERNTGANFFNAALLPQKSFS